MPLESCRGDSSGCEDGRMSKIHAPCSSAHALISALASGARIVAVLTPLIRAITSLAVNRPERFARESGKMPAITSQPAGVAHDSKGPSNHATSGVTKPKQWSHKGALSGQPAVLRQHSGDRKQNATGSADPEHQQHSAAHFVSSRRPRGASFVTRFTSTCVSFKCGMMASS